MAGSDVDMARALLHEVATQAYSLAMGLQNIAPPQVNTGSIEYLLQISLNLENASQKIANLPVPGSKKQNSF